MTTRKRSPEWVSQWPVDHDHAVWVMQARARSESLLGPWRVGPLRWLLTVAVEVDWREWTVGISSKRTKIGGVVAEDLRLRLVPCLALRAWWYWVADPDE